MTRSILFIHGFGGGRYEYYPVIKFLKKNSNPICYEFTYKKKFGQVSFKKIAEDLDNFIKANIKDSEVDIIGFSQGGIIARYYLAHYFSIKVRRCITICTPHKGSFMAHIGFLPGIKELQPKSKFLAELDSSKAEYYSVYNPFDLFVFPGWNSKFEHAKENKKVYSMLHQMTFWNRKTLEFIKKVLEK